MVSGPDFFFLSPFSSASFAEPHAASEAAIDTTAVAMATRRIVAFITGVPP